MLGGIDPESRRTVLSSARRRRFRRGEVLFHEGDPGESFHFLDRGRVAVRVTTPLGDIATLDLLGPGDTFGEQALLHSLRTGTVVALEATETLALHRDQFNELRARHPSVEQALIDILAAQVRRLTDQLLDALYVPVDKRVVRRLLAAHAVFDGGPVQLTQEDLSTMAGTTRPTANRVLQDLADAGCVALARGRIEILDPDALARRSR